MAHSFKDNAGREWTISLHTSNALDVRDKHGLDLTKMYKAEEIAKLNDIRVLRDVLFLLVKPEADLRSVSVYDFGASLGGDVFDEAFEAMWNEVVLFTPSRHRPTLQLIRDAGNRVEQLAEERLATVTPEAVAQEWLASSATPSSGATSSEASAVSTPAP